MESAMQNPQNRYHPKLGAMLTESTFKESSSASTTAKAATRLTQLPRVRPCSPASRKREGSMPPISPTNRHTLWSGYFSRKKASTLATPKKPSAAPTMTGSSRGTWVLNFLTGLESSSITGL